MTSVFSIREKIGKIKNEKAEWLLKSANRNKPLVAKKCFCPIETRSKQLKSGAKRAVFHHSSPGFENLSKANIHKADPDETSPFADTFQTELPYSEEVAKKIKYEIDAVRNQLARITLADSHSSLHIKEAESPALLEGLITTGIDSLSLFPAENKQQNTTLAKNPLQINDFDELKGSDQFTSEQLTKHHQCIYFNRNLLEKRENALYERRRGFMRNHPPEIEKSDACAISFASQHIINELADLEDDCHEKYFHIQSEGICDDGLNEIEEKIIQASSDENIVEICLLKNHSICEYHQSDSFLDCNGNDLEKFATRNSGFLEFESPAPKENVRNTLNG